MGGGVDLIKKLAGRLGFEVRRIPTVDPTIPDASLYRPFFSPWLGTGDFGSVFEAARPFTLITPERCYVLYTLALQATHLEGHWYECGVYQGGSAMILAKLLARRGEHGPTRLHLFDTFEGMPDTDPRKDLHRKGDFADTSIDAVRARIGSLVPDAGIVEFHKGVIPHTFRDLESHRIAFAHIDVDIYQSVVDCCHFIYPRMQAGGFMVFDDYGLPSCPGARKAVDEFFKDKPETPLVLSTTQAVVFRSGY